MITALTFAAVVSFSTAAVGETIVTVWNNAALAEVRASRLGPPIVARALAIAHTCMYDAWAAYDKDAVGTTDLGGTRRRPAEERLDANKAQAISFAAYRCLLNLFADSNLFPATGADAAGRLADVMVRQGYDPTNNSTDTTTPAGIGNVAAQAVIDARSGDGSNQYGDLKNPQNPRAPCPDFTGPYADYTCDKPRNAPMAFCTPLTPVCAPLDIDAPERWQPLIGPPELGSVPQKCIAPHWELVTPFALTSAGLSHLYGGIHFSDDNEIGQKLGTLIGQQAWAKAQTYFNGTASQ